MRFKGGTDAHYVLVAIEDQSLPPDFPDNMRRPIRFFYRATRRAIADLIAAGLVVHDDSGYTLTDEGERALLSIKDRGSYSTEPD
jgi:hypothetical protein